MTSQNALEAANISRSRTYHLRQTGETIAPASVVESLGGPLETARAMLRDDTACGIAVRHGCESLLAPTPPRPNAGLLPIVAAVLQQHGLTVRVQRQPAMRDLPPPTDSPCSVATNPELLDFIQLRAHGLIRHANSVSRARLIADVCHAWPCQTFALATATYDQALCLRRELYELRLKTTLVTARHCPELPGRIVIGTYTALAHTPVECNKRDIFLAANAAHAISEHAQRCLLQVDAGFRLFGFMSDDPRLSRWEWDRLIATFGLETISIPAHGYSEIRPAMAWVPFHWHAAAGGTDDTLASKRSLVWNSHVRNRRIARLARALVTGDHTAILAAAPDVAPTLAANDARRVITLVDGVDHAVALAERLRDWPIVVGQHVETHGLGARQRHLLAAGISRWVTGANAIVTSTGASRFDLVGGQTVIVWASAGRHLPPLPPAWRMVPTGRARNLLIVDIDDRGSGSPVECTQRRKAAYRQAEWLPPGTDLLTARIERFLAQRP